MAPIDGDLNVTQDNASKILKRDEFKNLTKEELMILANAKSDKISDMQEYKEVIKKSLEFEKNTFKIDSTDWKEVTEADKDDSILAEFVGNDPKVKVNITRDVVECLEWPAKWEQIFLTYDAFIREVMKAKKCTQEEVESKYLMTLNELAQKMKDKPYASKKYKEFYNQEIKWHFGWYWIKNKDGVSETEDMSSVWLVGGKFANFDSTSHYLSSYGSFTKLGFSGRLLKN